MDCTPLSPVLSPCPHRQGFEPISPPPVSAASSACYPAYYSSGVGKAEPLGRVKELPDVMEGSSEEEEEVDHELVEKKVKWVLLGTMLSGFSTAIARYLQGQGHHWLLLVGAMGIAGCLWVLGLLLGAHRGWDVGKCLRGPVVALGACGAWECQ